MVDGCGFMNTSESELNPVPEGHTPTVRRISGADEEPKRMARPSGGRLLVELVRL